MKSTRIDTSLTTIDDSSITADHSSSMHEWRVAKDAALEAYRVWSQAALDHRRLAYAVYRAAEDQEAAAAEQLRRELHAGDSRSGR